MQSRPRSEPCEKRRRCDGLRSRACILVCHLLPGRPSGSLRTGESGTRGAERGAGHGHDPIMEPMRLGGEEAEEGSVSGKSERHQRRKGGCGGNRGGRSPSSRLIGARFSEMCGGRPTRLMGTEAAPRACGAQSPYPPLSSATQATARAPP